MANLIKLDSGRSIETWYDRRSRNWITQLLDEDQCQLGNAEYSGTKEGTVLDQKVMREEDARLGPIEPKAALPKRLVLSGAFRAIDIETQDEMGQGECE